MNRLVVAAFVIGILVGLVGSYIFFSIIITGEMSVVKSWHHLTSFTLASNSASIEDIQVAYPIDHVSNDTTPAFTVTKDFWRVTVQTVPYFNYSQKYIAYYAPIPFTFRVIVPPPDSNSTPRFFSSMSLLEPPVYGVRTWIHRDLPGVSYASPNSEYVPVNAVYTFEGKGTYAVYVYDGTGCFGLEIEEYY